MARRETWKNSYDDVHVGYMTVEVTDLNEVLCSYELLSELLRHVGCELVEVQSDGS